MGRRGREIHVWFGIMDNAGAPADRRLTEEGGSLLNADILDSRRKLLGEEEVVEGLAGRLIPKTAREGIETLRARVTDGTR